MEHNSSRSDYCAIPEGLRKRDRDDFDMSTCIWYHTSTCTVVHCTTCEGFQVPRKHAPPRRTKNWTYWTLKYRRTILAQHYFPFATGEDSLEIVRPYLLTDPKQASRFNFWWTPRRSRQTYKNLKARQHTNTHSWFRCREKSSHTQEGNGEKAHIYPDIPIHLVLRSCIDLYKNQRLCKDQDSSFSISRYYYCCTVLSVVRTIDTCYRSLVATWPLWACKDYVW